VQHSKGLRHAAIPRVAAALQVKGRLVAGLLLGSAGVTLQPHLHGCLQMQTGTFVVIITCYLLPEDTGKATYPVADTPWRSGYFSWPTHLETDRSKLPPALSDCPAWQVPICIRAAASAGLDDEIYGFTGLYRAA
jgi:hypothetical protein